MLPDSQKTEIGSSKYETSPSAGKNNVKHGSVSLQLFPVGRKCPRSQGVICYDRQALHEGHKNYFKNLCLMN